MSVVLNGNTYDVTDFTGSNGYGYAQDFPATGLPLFPNSIFTDMLAELSAASTILSGGISPGAAGAVAYSNGSAWVRSATPTLTTLTLTGALTVGGTTEAIFLTPNGTTARYIVVNATAAYAGKMVLQAGDGSTGFGGAINLYGHSHATKPGDVVAGISAASGGKFRVNSGGLDDGTDWLTVSSASVTTPGHLLATTDNTKDIGASGATRFRTGYFGTSVVTPLVTATTLAGALSTAAQANVTSLGTQAAHLLFTDNTYDIGASGATRPRTGYFGTSVVAPTVNATSLLLSGDMTMSSATSNIIPGATAFVLRNHANSVSNVTVLDNGNTTFAGTVVIAALGVTANINASAAVQITGNTTDGHLYLQSIGGNPSALVNGMIWYDGTNFKCRLGGVTKTFTVA